MNRLFTKASLLLVAVLISGCSSSIVSVQRPSPELVAKGMGKKVGLSVRRIDRDNLYTRYDPERPVVKSAFNQRLLGGNGIDVSINAEDIVKGGNNLLSYLPVIASDASLTVPISNSSVKEALAQHQLDCLLLVNIGQVSNGDSLNINYANTAAFAVRMAAAAAGGATGGTGAGSMFGNSSFADGRVVMLYTCGEEIPLYAGGAQGTMKTFKLEQVADTTISDFKLALSGQKPTQK